MMKNMRLLKPVFFTNLLNDLDKIKDEYIYRYIENDHLQNWYKKKDMYLSKPSQWDDPFENIILNSQIRFKDGKMKRPFERNFVYGQCWTLQGRETDAFWRIYSPNKNRIRIRTTVKKLWIMLYQNFDSIPKIKTSIPYGLFMGKVEYLDKQKIIDIIKNTKIRQKYTSSVNKGIARSLLFKQIEFDHEKEVRIIVYDFHKQLAKDNTHFVVPNIDPSLLIDELLFDPRIDKKQFDKSKCYLSSFTKNIIKSELYSLPEI